MALPAPRSGQPIRSARTSAPSDDVNARISLVDQWVSRRMDEVQRAAARVDQRIELLNQAESRVIQLIESLRAETRTAEPLSRKLQAMTRDTEGEVARAMQAAHEQLPRLAQIVEQQTATCRQACQRVEDELKQTVAACTELLKPLQDQSRTIIESAAVRLHAELQPIVEQTLAQTQVHLEEQVASVAAALQGQLAEMTSQAKAQLDQAIHLHVQAAASDAKAGLADDLERHRTELEKMLTRRMDELEQAGDGYIAQFEQRLTQRLHAVKTSYQTQLDSAIRDLRGQSQALSESANARLHEELARLQSEVDTQLTWIQERMQQRIDRLTDQARTRTGQQLLQLEAAAKTLRNAPRPPESPTPEHVELSIHLPTPRPADSQAVG